MTNLEHKHGGRRRLIAVAMSLLLVIGGSAAEPLDLFSDEPSLETGFIRLGAWNLRHINLESGAADFLPGTTSDADFQILIATFGKAIKDLGLDLVAVVEHQPREGEPDRLLQIRDELRNITVNSWEAEQSSIAYDHSEPPFGGLQFGVLWNSARITINPASIRLLQELRQPRDAAGNLLNRNHRIPWLVPVQAGGLEFDLMVLHLKSGGDFPQADEVNAIESFVRTRLSAPAPRHLIVCGDWNIRPDREQGRARLAQMEVATSSGPLMRIVTIEASGLTLAEWQSLGSVLVGTSLAKIVPVSHYDAMHLDSFLDHMAISRTLNEIFDHPIEVVLGNGARDLRAGVRLATPLVREEDYRKLTDHLPVVITLRTTAPAVPAPPLSEPRIVGALPNPASEETQNEEVHLRNFAAQPIPLVGWEITDALGTKSWKLTPSDGTAQPNVVVTIKRNGRAMGLDNAGDTIILKNPAGVPVDHKIYVNAASGQVFHF